ncbi:MAG: hypothetical protein ACREBC_31460, partial [Pyrinomonadaceae bacterium]
TNAETGNSYRTFAVWKPSAARSAYIHDHELKEKYRPVIPSKDRDWWIRKHASVPPIETLETPIIGGAIIPLWQRFKTHEEARLKVVRVTTDDGQRIVGIRIPPEQVGPIVRALGATRDLREPGEIFTGILDEGEEVTLVSGLKLCRRFLHRESVIELCGADPYKFAELRSLSLLNEQIDWKQRFFVPTDEGAGIAVLSDLLARYPIITSDVLTDDEPRITEIEPHDLEPTNVVDLNGWFVPVADSEQSMESPPLPSEQAQESETAEAGWTRPAFARPSQTVREVEEIQLALDFG